MTLPENTIEELEKPIHPKVVAERKQGTAMLKYIEAVDVVRAANRIFGFGQWGYEVIDGPKVITSGERKSRDGSNVTPWYIWQVTVKVTIIGQIPMFGVGASIQSSDAPEAAEMAIKAADTDALKRAFKNYGSQFGLDLYDKEDALNVVENYREWRAEEKEKAKAKAEAETPTPAASEPPAPSQEPSGASMKETAKALGFRERAAEAPVSEEEAPDFDSAEGLVAWKSTRLWEDISENEQSMLVNRNAKGDPITTKKHIAKLIEMSVDEASTYFKEHGLSGGIAGTYINALINIDEDEPEKTYRMVKLEDEHLVFWQKNMPGRTYIDLMHDAAEWCAEKLSNEGFRDRSKEWVKAHPRGLDRFK